MDLGEVGRNPPDVTLGHIVKDLLLFFNGFECLHEAKSMIEKKCGINKQPEHKCWPEDDIKRAWEETKKMNIKSSRRRHWARVIILQVVKSFVCDTCKQNAAQKNRHSTADEQGCETRPNPKDTASQSNNELETVRAAGKASKDSGAASGSERSALSTDEAPSPAEENSNNSETGNAALVNANEDTLLNSCEQQKDVDYCELPVADVHDKENVKFKNGLCPTVYFKQPCGKAQAMKENSENSGQSSAAPQKEAAGGIKQQTTNLNYGRPGRVSKGQSDDSDASDDQSGTDDRGESEIETGLRKRKLNDTIFIYIPLSEMFANEPPSNLPQTGTHSKSEYILLDELPKAVTECQNNNIKIKRKKCYVMSYNNTRKSATWVYEILNMSTLTLYKKPEFKVSSDSDSDSDSKDPTFKLPERSHPSEDSNYDRGHLAAAANHMWCQEAYKDTYLMSNVTPQHKDLNRGKWKKLEEYCRKKILTDKVRNVHVYTGPLYLKNSVNDSGTAVPSHYFKVVIVEKKSGELELECYKMPNEKKQTEDNENSKEDNWLKHYKVDIIEIEENSGLKFTEDCSELPKEVYTRTATWMGNNKKKSVTVDVTISSCKRNDEGRHLAQRSTELDGRCDDGLWSTDDISQAQNSAALNIVEAVDGVKQQTTNTNQGQTDSVSQGQTGAPYQTSRQSSANDPGAPNDQSRTNVSAVSQLKIGPKKRKKKFPTYIRIPLTKMFGNKAISTSLQAETILDSEYKLIDRPPKKNKKTGDTIKKNGFYVMLFNEDKNHAEWVYEILNKNTLPCHYVKPQYKDDQRDPDFKDTSKRNPNFDRGHLAAAANHIWCQEAYEETYLMSNITPQNKNLNRGAWKNLETYCRDKILNNNVRNVHVYTGPLYLEKSGNEIMLEGFEYVDGKAKPTHYFKVLIVENEDGTVELECFWIPNGEGQMYEQVDIEEIEKLSGLRFTEDYNELSMEEQHTRTTTWEGKKSGKSVTIDVTINSCTHTKNYGYSQVLNEE